MTFLIHDTTDTQTDSPWPLSRKKLRQLMLGNRANLTAKALQHTGRRRGLKLLALWKQKRQARQNKRKLFEKRALPGGITFQLMPNAADKAAIAPTLLERMFAVFKRKRERGQAKGL
jgi:hypothetical protein